jgi:hypothetical protein
MKLERSSEMKLPPSVPVVFETRTLKTRGPVL